MNPSQTYLLNEKFKAIEHSNLHLNKNFLVKTMSVGRNVEKLELLNTDGGATVTKQGVTA